MEMKDIFLNIFISLFSAWFFWILTFKISRTNIIFANQLIKSDRIKKGGYRFKFANIGYRDLIEVTVAAKLRIKGTNSNQVVPLDVSGYGGGGFIIILPGMKTYYKLKGFGNMRIMSVFMSKSAQERLSKLIDFKKKKHKIRLKDVFEICGEKVEIVIYIYGNDSVTGARKMFKSKVYTIYDIIENESYKFKKTDFKLLESKRKKQKKISEIHRRPF